MPPGSIRARDEELSQLKGLAALRCGLGGIRLKAKMLFRDAPVVQVIAIILLMLGVVGNPRAASGRDEYHEYDVEAAFIYNFCKFVEWPSGTFANASDPIGICIIGQNPFGSTLEDMVQGKKIGDRAFVVRRLRDTQQVRNCQILFVAAGESKRTRSLLEAFKGAGILTVGETDDFTAAGGINAAISVAAESDAARSPLAPPRWRPVSRALRVLLPRRSRGERRPHARSRSLGDAKPALSCRPARHREERSTLA
jgi:hypothetical protein